MKKQNQYKKIKFVLLTYCLMFRKSPSKQNLIEFVNPCVSPSYRINKKQISNFLKILRKELINNDEEIIDFLNDYIKEGIYDKTNM